MWSISSSKKESQKSRELVTKKYHEFRGRSDLGFMDLTHFKQAIADCQAHQKQIKKFKEIVVIGLGGSSLGTKAICEALAFENWQEKVHFLDNVDAHSVDLFLDQISNPEELGWVLCSKSGGTIEVVNLYDYCHQVLLKKHNTSIVDNTMVVTEEKESPLFNFAKKNDVPLLFMPISIGGRFSVFTPIGLFPLSFLNFDLDKAFAGYQQVLNDENFVVELASHLYESHVRGDQAFYCFQYCDRLNHWGLWLQQLWSESLGKAVKRDGSPASVVSTFLPCRGASDQHSVLQQLIEGPELKFACFHRVESSEKGNHLIHGSVFENSLMNGRPLGQLLAVEAQATQEAVSQAGTPTICLSTSEVDETSLSFLMGAWMLTIGVLGELFDINAFDQPGVESGKAIARRVLSRSD